jgi:hypothetical protein
MSHRKRHPLDIDAPIDNNSTDETAEIVRSTNKAHLFFTKDTFLNKCFWLDVLYVDTPSGIAGLKQRFGESRVDLMAYGRTPWS